MRPVTGRTRPPRVVVVGASLAGMLAAAASAGAGRSVTVLERDTLPQGPRPRDGVPQGRHAHVYLQRGLEALEELLPGFGAELRAAGAVPFDTGALAWLGELGWAPPARQFDVVSATRPLFEHLVLQRVRAIPGVTVRDGVRVVGLRRGTGGGSAWAVDVADGGSVPADLVVDASGRASRLPSWLAGVGVGPAAVSEVDARIGYSTRVLRLDARRVGPAGVVLLQTPGTRRGGLALPDAWFKPAVGLVLLFAAWRMLSPAMARELGGLKIATMTPACTVHWQEVVAGGADLSPAAQRVVDAWRNHGARVHSQSVIGEPFWATQEIPECPSLIEASLASMETAPS